jgi:hypothetical protein
MKINKEGDFDLDKVGMSFSYNPQEDYENGPINTTLTWNLDCEEGDLDFSEGIVVSSQGQELVKQYKFEITLEDQDNCGFKREDKLEIELNIKFPNELSPNVFQIDQDEITDSLGYYFNLEEEVSIDVKAIDGDTDNIDLYAIGANFNLEEYGAEFENKVDRSGVEPGIVTSFQWFLDADKFNLSELDSFRVYFITEDLDVCNVTKGDTLSIDFLIDNNVIENVTSIEKEYVEGVSVEIYPNPIVKYFHVKLPEELSDQVKFDLINFDGRKTIEFDHSLISKGFYRIFIESDLSSGIYFLKTSTRRYDYINKIIVE